MLIANNILSVLLIGVLFWLAHENSAGKEPYSRAISCGYGFWALLVAFVMLFRNAEFENIEWLTLAAKGVMVYTLTLVLFRLKRIYH